MLLKPFKGLTNSLIRHLRIFLLILLLFAVFNTVSIYKQIESTTNDSRIVNYAGIVRGKTQRLVKLTFTQQLTPSEPLSTDELVDELPTDESDETPPAGSSATTRGLTEDSQQKINTIIPELDQIVVGLVEGSEELQLVRINDSDFQTNMQQLATAWNQLKIEIERFQTEPTSANRRLLLRNSESYWDLTNETVFAAEAYAKAHIGQSKQLILTIFGVNLILLVILFRLSQQLRKNLKTTINNLTTSSLEMSSTATQQERIASQQAASVNETTTTMEELEAASRQSENQAITAVQVANSVLERTEVGRKAVDESLAGMDTLDHKVNTISELSINLSDQASQIGDISEIAGELATKTNVLALNASVEAVRAGENGKGFSVVANEIRKLSDQSQASVEKINTLVADIQALINQTVMAAEEGTKTVKSSTQLAKRTEAAFADIKQGIETVVTNNKQVALTQKQQLDAIHQVTIAMSTIDRGAQESASGLSQTRAGTEHLSETVTALQKMV
ncbi:MAG: methyl-accepting chemotaxis protein [Cyanobacteria bacterium P01_G01_bin.38]